MKTRFNITAYRHRAQAETVFSMMKRNLGAALRARSYWGRNRDLYLRVLTHNIALALAWVFYRADSSPYLIPNRSVNPIVRTSIAAAPRSPITTPRTTACRVDSFAG